MYVAFICRVTTEKVILTFFVTLTLTFHITYSNCTDILLRSMHIFCEHLVVIGWKLCLLAWKLTNRQTNDPYIFEVIRLLPVLIWKIWKKYYLIRNWLNFPKIFIRSLYDYYSLSYWQKSDFDLFRDLDLDLSCSKVKLLPDLS